MQLFTLLNSNGLLVLYYACQLGIKRHDLSPELHSARLLHIVETEATITVISGRLRSVGVKVEPKRLHRT